MPTYIAGTCRPLAYKRRIDATIHNPARIVAFAAAACELELPTCIEVGPAKEKKKKLNIYILHTFNDIILIYVGMHKLPSKQYCTDLQLQLKSDSWTEKLLQLLSLSQLLSLQNETITIRWCTLLGTTLLVNWTSFMVRKWELKVVPVQQSAEIGAKEYHTCVWWGHGGGSWVKCSSNDSCNFHHYMIEINKGGNQIKIQMQSSLSKLTYLWGKLACCNNCQHIHICILFVCSLSKSHTQHSKMLNYWNFLWQAPEGSRLFCFLKYM